MDQPALFEIRIDHSDSVNLKDDVKAQQSKTQDDTNPFLNEESEISKKEEKISKRMKVVIE